MTTKQEIHNRARFDLTRLAFYRAHPELAVCTSNDNWLEAKMDELLLDATEAKSWEAAFRTDTQHFLAGAIPPPAAPAPEPEVVDETPDESWSKERLDAYWVANDPRRQKPTVEKRVLPADYTPQKLQQISGRELNSLAKQYTFSVINDRLNGRS
jgi:hypothetical protein